MLYTASACVHCVHVYIYKDIFVNSSLHTYVYIYIQERSLQADRVYIQGLINSYTQSGHFALYQQWYPWQFRIDNIVIEFGGSFTYANNRLTIHPTLGRSANRIDLP